MWVVAGVVTAVGSTGIVFRIGRYLHTDGHVAERRLVSRCHHVLLLMLLLLLWIDPVVKV